MIGKIFLFLFRLFLACFIIPIAFFLFNLLCLVYLAKLYWTGDNDIKYFVDYVENFSKELKDEQIKSDVHKSGDV